MTANPFTVQITKLNVKLRQMERKRQEAADQLAHWNSQISHFENQDRDVDKANAEFRQAERKVASLQTLKVKFSAEAAALVELTKKLEEKAGLGIDPRRWLSAEREVAKRHLNRVQLDLVTQQLKVAKSSQEYEAAQTHLRNLETKISLLRAFDHLGSQAAVAALQGTLERLQSCMDEISLDINRLQPLQDALDASLLEPLKHLREDEAERKLFFHRIARAEHFLRLLDDAILQNDRKEKWQIHKACGEELGDGKPIFVIQRCRESMLRIEVRIQKSQERVSSVIRMATNEVRHIVIDGNNLCYAQGNRKLKNPLAALEALVDHLAAKYKVTLIFDPGIVGVDKTRRTDKDSYIKGRFPKAYEVYICPSKNDADQTALNIAEDDPHTYILSNDNYSEYREQAAVREQRVLRYNIVASMVLIHELGVRIKFECSAPASGTT